MELFYVTTLREFLLAMMMMIRGGLRCRIGSAGSLSLRCNFRRTAP
jgi:hypothetical protein